MALEAVFRWLISMSEAFVEVRALLSATQVSIKGT